LLPGGSVTPQLMRSIIANSRWMARFWSLNANLDRARSNARVVVVGVCMQTNSFEPSLAVTKALNLRFVLGYSADEYTASLHAIAEGHIDNAAYLSPASPLLVRQIGVASRRAQG
jgi:threonine dehydrogenase-like Zn-dependent dehydrogenase